MVLGMGDIKSDKIKYVWVMSLITWRVQHTPWKTVSIGISAGGCLGKLMKMFSGACDGLE